MEDEQSLFCKHFLVFIFIQNAAAESFNENSEHFFRFWMQFSFSFFPPFLQVMYTMRKTEDSKFVILANAVNVYSSPAGVLLLFFRSSSSFL